MTLSEGGAYRCGGKQVKLCTRAESPLVSTSGTVHFSSTLDSRNSSPRAAKRMLQPPFQSNKVPLSAEPAKTIAKCVYLAKKRVELLCIKSSFSSATERHKKINEVETKRESCRLISVP